MSRLKPALLSLSILLALLLSLLLPTQVAGQASPPAQSADLDDVQALEDFFDGAVAAQRAAYPVAGMTVSVVKDGEPIFAKGYGYADVEKGVPVQADETLFRAGSVSKLLVWTAMMQLVEEDALDLDADVNTYLDFQIPPAFGQPITLRHLMTHTPGFEDQGLGLYVATEAEMAPLGQYLAENIPERVFPPGELSAYSNYGASLAGYIVQQVSGMPFYEYVETHIFAPLGMQHSTFRQFPPPPLADDVSQGYSYRQGRFEEAPFEYIQPYPAGALSTTATDMARFMIAHLQNGRLGEARILEEATARQMHELAFSHDPRLPGWGVGFTVSEEGGRRTTGHGGDTTYFHSELLLLPEEDVGLFISTNTDRGTFARFHLMQAFLERYFGQGEGQRPQPPADFLQRAGAYTGTYYPARMNVSSIEKILLLLQPVQVRANEEGLLVATGLLGSEPTYWAEIDRHLFAPVSHNLPPGSRLLFQPEDGGPNTGDEAIEYAFFQQSAYIKQPFYAAPGFHYALLGVSLFFFLSMLIATPAGALIHRRYRRAAPDEIATQRPGARLARWLAWLFALLGLAFLLIFFLTVSDISNVIFGLPPFLEAVLLAPWVLVALTVPLVTFAALAWLRRYWTTWGRLFYTLFTLAALAYLWFLWYWNLL